MRYYWLPALLLLQLLTACQYMSYFKTNTTAYPGDLQSSPESVCQAMGSMRGDASFDRCVAQEEADRKRRLER